MYTGGGPAFRKATRSSGGLYVSGVFKNEKPHMLMYDPQSGGFGIRDDDLKFVRR